jgi:hypothetical protein
LCETTPPGSMGLPARFPCIPLPRPPKRGQSRRAGIARDEIPGNRHPTFHPPPSQGGGRGRVPRPAPTPAPSPIRPGNHATLQKLPERRQSTRHTVNRFARLARLTHACLGNGRNAIVPFARAERGNLKHRGGRRLVSRTFEDPLQSYPRDASPPGYCLVTNLPS